MSVNKHYYLAIVIYLLIHTAPMASAQELPMQEVLNKTRGLYMELLGFKGESKFHQVGFGRCCQYYKWLEKVGELQNHPNAGLLLGKEIVVGDLKMLGLEYAKKGGVETEYTVFINRAFKSAFE